MKLKITWGLLFLTIALTLWQGRDAFSQAAVFNAQYSVVMLTVPGNSTQGGTGFILNTPAGPRTITNAHVCESASGTYLMANIDNKPRQLLRILKKDTVKDLCMLEPVYGLDSLEMGKYPHLPQKAWTIGHPNLSPLTIESGYIISRVEIPIPISLYDEATCTGPGAEKVNLFFYFACVQTFIAWYSNIQTFPGNSGSPVLNSKGKVVAVVFAASGSAHGYFVTYEDLAAFIDPLPQQ